MFIPSVASFVIVFFFASVASAQSTCISLSKATAYAQSTYYQTYCSDKKGSEISDNMAELTDAMSSYGFAKNFGNNRLIFYSSDTALNMYSQFCAVTSVTTSKTGALANLVGRRQTKTAYIVDCGYGVAQVEGENLVNSLAQIDPGLRKVLALAVKPKDVAWADYYVGFLRKAAVVSLELQLFAK